LEVEKAEMQKQLDEVLSRDNGKENPMVMGDWNAVDGEADYGNAVVEFGWGSRNEKGEREEEITYDKSLVISNALFMQHLRRRHTWKILGDRALNQIAYIVAR
jgi:hypothetical protein